MKSVALHNLGCKVNSYEIEVMQQKLQERGYNIVAFDEIADVYIINTCTVTNIADRKSRQMIHRAKKKNPNAVVVAVGCYVQTGGEKVKQDESIDLAIGNNQKKDIVSILENYLLEKSNIVFQENQSLQNDLKISGSQNCTNHKSSLKSWVIDINNTCEYEEMKLKQTMEHTRAYIKIQDGCNQFCTYCIIPYARGRVRSRYREEILKEVQGLADAGYQEIVLTGIHISSYGIDFEEDAWKQGKSKEVLKEENKRDYSGSSKLIDLIESLHKIEGLHRIRLGSLEPRIITKENAYRLAALPKVCPHFHLSLQSGCDETLKRMNRHYMTREYFQCVEILRSVFDNPAITTDVIVGFPGETEEEFRITKAFLEKVGFYEMHVFKYSRRSGTKAAEMLEQVSDFEKTKRSNELLELEKQQSLEFRRCYIGKETEVLFEETKEIKGRKYQVGYTADYVKVALEIQENLSNCLRKVKIKELLTEEILNSISMH